MYFPCQDSSDTGVDVVVYPSARLRWNDRPQKRVAVALPDVCAQGAKEMTYITRPITWIVLPEGDSICSECGTEVHIVDEARGEFVELRQTRRIYEGKHVCVFDIEEFPALFAAVELAVAEIKKHDVTSVPRTDAIQTGTE